MNKPDVRGHCPSRAQNCTCHLGVRRLWSGSGLGLVPCPCLEEKCRPFPNGEYPKWPSTLPTELCDPSKPTEGCKTSGILAQADRVPTQTPRQPSGRRRKNKPAVGAGRGRRASGKDVGHWRVHSASPQLAEKQTFSMASALVNEPECVVTKPVSDRSSIVDYKSALEAEMRTREMVGYLRDYDNDIESVPPYGATENLKNRPSSCEVKIRSMLRARTKASSKI